jgi:hypothetical protein
MIVAALAVVAGCTSGGQAAVTTTAIVHLPSGFHAARPTDGAAMTRPAARPRGATTELATLRLEGAHRRAVAALAAEPASSASGSFVCQIDMGTAPLD